VVVVGEDVGRVEEGAGEGAGWGLDWAAQGNEDLAGGGESGMEEYGREVALKLAASKP
jgi:hypothetical protein